MWTTPTASGTCIVLAGGTELQQSAMRKPVVRNRLSLPDKNHDDDPVPEESKYSGTS